MGYSCTKDASDMLGLIRDPDHPNRKERGCEA